MPQGNSNVGEDLTFPFLCLTGGYDPPLLKQGILRKENCHTGFPQKVGSDSFSL